MRQSLVEALAEKGRKDVVVGDRRRHRQIARGQPLGEADDVRGDTRLLHGEHGAGAAEAGRHLVEDDENAGGPGNVDQALEKFRTAHAHAAGALQQRLDDQSGDILRAVPQAILERGKRTALAILGRLVAVERVGEGQHRNLAHEIAMEREEARAAADRHGAERVAVIAAVEGDEDAAFSLAAIGPILIGHLQGDLDRGGAVIRIEDAREIAGEHSGERARQVDGRAMREAGEHHMLECFRLAGERGIELRMRVSVSAGPPGGDEVEDLAALRVVERRVARAFDQDRLALGAVLRVGMPDIALVARQDVFRLRLGGALVGCVVHAAARASWARSSSGSMSSRLS